ncbi:MAG TPA: DsbA family protein [Methyloceanibacter sp.]|nr:DsbA family protein [Methyloceanibacter sp.]
MFTPQFFLRLVSFALLGLAAGYFLSNYVLSGRQDTAIAEHAEAIYRSPSSFVAGNPQGDVSMVAFFDYNCPYCRAGAPELAKLVANDGKVRLVLKELPVLGPDSEEVARVAQAAQAQGKYFELYEKLIGQEGRATKGRALAIAADLGLDRTKLEQDMAGTAVESAIADNMRLASAIRVKGVPFYLVGDRTLPPNAATADFAAAVADVRAHGCEAKC